MVVPLRVSPPPLALELNDRQNFFKLKKKLFWWPALYPSPTHALNDTAVKKNYFGLREDVKKNNILTESSAKGRGVEALEITARYTV